MLEFFLRILQNSEVYPYPNKICSLCLNNLKNAFEFKQRCVNAFEKLMKLSDFNTVYTEEYDEVKPFMHVDVLIDENDALNEENYTHFDENDTHFNEDETNEAIEPQVNIFLNWVLLPQTHLFQSFIFPLPTKRNKRQRKNIEKRKKIQPRKKQPNDHKPQIKPSPINAQTVINPLLDRLI